MIIKTGSIVSHPGAHEWGVGKVLEVSPGRATIQFSDGKSRKIASSHYTILQPADAASYVAPACAPDEKARTTTRAKKKPKPKTV